MTGAGAGHEFGDSGASGQQGGVEGAVFGGGVDGGVGMGAAVVGRRKTEGTTEDTEDKEKEEGTDMALAMMGQSMMGQFKKPDEPLLKAPDLSGMLAGLNTPVQGLTAGQKDVMKARLAAQGKTGLRGVLEQLGTALGQSSTAFALNAARMRQGVGSDVAGKMAEVDVGEAQANRAAEFQRRAQMLQGAGLQGQLFGIEKGAETSRYGIDQSKGLHGTLAGIEAAFKSGNIWPGSEAADNLMQAISKLAGVDLTKGTRSSQFQF